MVEVEKAQGVLEVLSTMCLFSKTGTIYGMKRFYQLDLIRVFASLFVVAIHVDEITASSSNYVGGVSWWLLAVSNSIFRTAVPLFVLLSGKLLYQRLSDQNYANNRALKRLILPFFISFVFLSVWDAQWFGANLSLRQFFESLGKGGLGHLYFLPLLAGLYLVTPILHRLNRVYQPIKLVGVSLLFSLVTNLLTHYQVVDLGYMTTISLFLPFVFYYLVGAYLVPDKLIKSSYLFFVLCLAIGVNTGLYYFSLTQSSFEWLNWESGYYLWTPFSPTMIVVSLGFWVLASRLEVSGKFFLKNQLGNFSRYTYLVYIVHPFVIDVLDRYFGFAIHLAKEPILFHYLFKLGVAVIVSCLISMLFDLMVRQLSPKF